MTGPRLLETTMDAFFALLDYVQALRAVLLILVGIALGWEAVQEWSDNGHAHPISLILLSVTQIVLIASMYFEMQITKGLRKKIEEFNKTP